MSTFSPVLLRERRHAAGLSQEQMAVAIGRCYASIRNYERGYAPPAEVLAKLAQHLGCEVADFFEQAA